MSYKGFDLTLVASGVFGNDILRAYRMPDSPSQNYTSEILGRWTGPGTSNSIPAYPVVTTSTVLTSPTFIWKTDHM